MNKLSRQIIISGLSLSFIIVGSIVYAGWERWSVSNFLQGNEEPSKVAQRFETKIKNEEYPQESLYNLAYIHYKQNKFEDAIKGLRNAQGKGTLGNEFEKKLLFNLGNSLFRRSEAEEDLKKAIQNMKQSLDAYRNVLEIEKSEEQFGKRNIVSDKDLVYNFTLARKRLKILLDELKKKTQQEQAQKTIYQLIQEIKEDEEKINMMTNKLITAPYSQDASKIGKEILAIRTQLPEKVEILKKKVEMLQENSTNNKPGTAPPNHFSPSTPPRQPHSNTI